MVLMSGRMRRENNRQTQLGLETCTVRLFASKSLLRKNASKVNACLRASLLQQFAEMPQELSIFFIWRNFLSEMEPHACVLVLLVRSKHPLACLELRSATLTPQTWHIPKGSLECQIVAAVSLSSTILEYECIRSSVGSGGGFAFHQRCILA